MSTATALRPTGTIDVVARLLATENITLVRANASTASFDIKNRILTLPTWKEMNEAEELMLVLHETAHALFTLQNEYKIIFEELKHLRTYANVLEDVRIEKLMKERYPGSRRQFSDGYNSLNARDFFGVKTLDLDDLLLIDKINLYFKVGRLCGVKFDKAEEQFVMRAERVNTIAEVIELAKDIYAFSKQKMEEKMNDVKAQLDLDGMQGENGDEGESIDGEYKFEDGDGEDGLQNAGKYGNSSEDKESSEDELESIELESITEKAYQSNVEQLADTNLNIRYFEPTANSDIFKHVMVSYKECIEDITTQIERRKQMNNTQTSFMDSRRRKIEKFKSSNNPFINYLVKEFEMRKSAAAYRRAKLSKVGQLDMKKIYAYKLKEDLFKQVMTKPEGKNHGMIFLLDWSGSMTNSMDNTVEQVIALAAFCQRIQIPYQVLAFSDSYSPMKFRDATTNYGIKKVYGTNGLQVQSFHLLELFSHKMKQSEFNFMQDALLSKVYHSNINFWGLSGTPLNEALLYMVDYVGEFKKMYNVEKLSFITLTDGEGSALQGASQRIMNGKEWGSTLVHKSMLRDPMTGLQYNFSDNSTQQTNTLLQVTKDRYDAKMIGFFVFHNASQYKIRRFINYNSSSRMGHSNIESLILELRRKRAIALKNFASRDEMYIIVGTDSIQDNEIEANENMSSSQLSKQLSKVMNNKKHSRVVLDRFLNLVC